jgi:hypothetical protein
MMALTRPMDRRISIQGQSNAVGVADRADLSSSPLSADTGLAAFNASPFPRVFIFNNASGNYEPLTLGTNNAAYTSTVFGPEFGIAVRWMRETVKGNLYIDKFAESGQPISYFQSGQSFFTSALSYKAAQDAWLVANKVRPARMGWLWLQGESDSGASQAQYESALTTLISDRIANGLQDANGMRLLMQMYVGSSMYGSGVSAAKTSYASANPTTTRVIPLTNNFKADNVHLNGRGMLQVGYDAYSAFFSRPILAA